MSFGSIRFKISFWYFALLTLTLLILGTWVYHDLSRRLLDGLRRIRGEMDIHGFPVLLSRVNALWDLPRQVELDLGRNVLNGWFEGVDGAGRLA